MKALKVDRPLDRVKSDSKVVIQSISGDKSFIRRAAGRGFTPAASLYVIQNIGIGPLLVYLQDSMVALGRGEAKKIIVRKEDNAP